MSLVGAYPSHQAAAYPPAPDFYYHHHHHHHPASQPPPQRYDPYPSPDAYWVPDLPTAAAASSSMGVPYPDDDGPLEPGVQYKSMQLFDVMPDGTIKVRTVKRRVTANKKERRRTLSINTAFANLRGCIPNVPSDTKLSKIKTLRLATSYIAYLMDILNKDDPHLDQGGFKAEITKKIESREEKRKREAEEILRATSGPDRKKSKGRTGWPQAVWASELGPSDAANSTPLNNSNCSNSSNNDSSGEHSSS